MVRREAETWRFLDYRPRSPDDVRPGERHAIVVGGAAGRLENAEARRLLAVHVTGQWRGRYGDFSWLFLRPVCCVDGLAGRKKQPYSSLRHATVQCRVRLTSAVKQAGRVEQKPLAHSGS